MSALRTLRACYVSNLSGNLWKNTSALNRWCFRQPYSLIYKVPKKMVAEKILPSIFKFVDQNTQSYKDLLKEAVAIPSVSSDAKYRNECVRMVEWTRDKLKEVGATVELRDVGFQVIDNQQVKLPPVLVGILGNVMYNFHIFFYEYYFHFYN